MVQTLLLLQTRPSEYFQTFLPSLTGFKWPEGTLNTDRIWLTISGSRSSFFMQT